MKSSRQYSCPTILSTVALAIAVCLQPAAAATAAPTGSGQTVASLSPATPTGFGQTVTSASPIAPTDPGQAVASLSLAAPAAPPAALTETTQAATPTSTDEIAILTPTPDTVLDQPATSLTIQYPIETKVDVLVNGEAADRGLIGRTETNQTTGRVTETWYGLILNEGKNTISLHRAGELKPSAQVQVQVSGQPTKIKVSTLETRIPADGRSTATIQGELQDKDGNLSNWSADVTLDTSAGEFIGTDQAPDSPGFQVKVNHGRFTAVLRSTSQAQAVRVRAQTGSLEGYYQFQFETPIRKSLLSTGVLDFRLGARGTNYYDRFQDFLPADGKNNTVLDVKGAAFATTSIGSWLFTGAFNSARTLNENADGRSQLLGTVQPSDQQYPTYGDSSVTEKVTPSQDSLFLRLERTSPIKNAGFDYVMWGDFTTEEFATPSQEFTATNRTLHGLKANYNLGSFQLSALYSNTVQGFQRDTIAPDGTSGFYFVSRRNLLEGSENIVIELEELNRPGTVVSAQQLVRSSDYTIDYDRGSLLFRDPILRTDTAADGTLLVRRIVVTYQYDTPGTTTSIYAGRARYHFSRAQGLESWIGGTYWREDQGSRLFELFGADARIALGTQGHITAEYAHSNNALDTTGGAASGSAYRIEIEGTPLKGWNGRAFYRTAEAGFSNNATLSFVPGQTRYGAAVTGQIGTSTRIIANVDHEENFGIAPLVLTDLDLLLHPGTAPIPGERQDNSLTTLRAGVEQQIGKARLGVNFVHRDRIDRASAVNLTSSSNQLETTFSVPLQQKLTFNALGAFNLSGNDPIYTNHVQAGLDWQIHPNVSIQLNQHYFWDGQYGNRAVTSLDTVGHYDLFKNTQLTGRFSLLGGADNLTGQGAAGIKHHWQIVPGVNMNVAYEYVMGQFFGRTAAGQQFEQAYAVGSGASALGVGSGHNFSIGVDYTDNPDLKASFNYQYRTSSAGVNSVLTGDILGKFNDSITGLGHFDQAGAANQLLGLLGDTANLRVGIAYRNPTNDKFNALFRYDYRQNPSITPDTILLGSGTGSSDHTLSAETIYAPNWRWELYGKVGFRYSKSYLANDFINSSTLFLSQLRATYRLNYRWDLTAEGRMINTLSAGGTEFGATAEVGYYLTPNLRFAAGYSFGSVTDGDLNRHAGGPYVGLTVKLDELFSGFRLLKKKPIPETPAPIAEPTAEVSEPAATPADLPAPAPASTEAGSNPQGTEAGASEKDLSSSSEPASAKDLSPSPNPASAPIAPIADPAAQSGSSLW